MRQTNIYLSSVQTEDFVQEKQELYDKLATQDNLTTLLYFVKHSSQFIVYSLSCNQSLCTGIKVKRSLVLKVLSHLLTVINLKQCSGFIIKSFFIVPHFCLPFRCSYGTSLVQIISRKQSNIAKSVINPFTESFPLENLMDLIAKVHIIKLKI